MKHEITARRLKEALETARIIPAELSERSGVSQSSISQYLSGSHAPSNISSGKMAKVLGCDPVWLMGFGVENPAPSTAHDGLSEDERILVRGYRVASPDRREDMLDLARKALKSKEGVTSSSSRVVGEETA